MMVATKLEDLYWSYKIIETDGTYSLVEMYDSLKSWAVILQGYESPQEVIDDLKLMLKDVTNE